MTPSRLAVVIVLLALASGHCPGAAAQSPAPFAVKDAADFFNLLDLDRPELAPVRKAVAGSDWPAAKQAWAKHLETRVTPRWVWLHRDREAIR
jgi:hypothetical protein